VSEAPIGAKYLNNAPFMNSSECITSFNEWRNPTPSPTADLGDAYLSTQSFQHYPDFFFTGVFLVGPPLNFSDNTFGAC
jgi:hypothetical protein